MQDFCSVGLKRSKGLVTAKLSSSWVDISKWKDLCSVEFLEYVWIYKSELREENEIMSSKVTKHSGRPVLFLVLNLSLCPTLCRPQGAERTQMCMCRFLGKTWAYIGYNINGRFMFFMKILPQDLVRDSPLWVSTLYCNYLIKTK